MHFLGGVVVAVPKISLRLTDDEVAFLSALSEELRMTKSEIIRMALRKLFDRCFNQSPKILLSNSGFQNLLDEVEKNPSAQTLKRREKIRKYILWS